MKEFPILGGLIVAYATGDSYTNRRGASTRVESPFVIVYYSYHMPSILEPFVLNYIRENYLTLEQEMIKSY